MGDTLHFECDFGDGLTCVVKVDLNKFRRKASDFVVFQWSKKRTAAIFPAYLAWMHTVNCDIANAINGTHIYASEQPNGGVEVWVYRPGGNYQKASSGSKALAAITNDPNVNVMISDDKEAQTLLGDIGLLDKFTHVGNFPGPSVQLLAYDGLPTHWLAVIFFHGLADKKDNGFLVHLLPRSGFSDPNASQTFLDGVKTNYERQGLRVVIHN